MSKANRLVAGIATALLTVVLAACGGGGGSTGGNVATVNGQPISHAELDQKLETSPAARGVVQQMVTNDLIDSYAKQKGITVSSAEIAKVEDQYKAQYPNGQWDELLKARGLTEQDVQDLIRRQIILDKAVGGNIHITDKQITDYFNKNHAQFDKPPMARARHILVPDLKTAQKVEADLKSGKDFAAEAKQYSTDPGSRDKGGELGWFRKGQMVPAFEKYAFSGPIGKVSPPIKSPFGYHIIQVEDRKPGQTASVASARDQITQQLRQQQEAPLIPTFLQQLQSSANIKIEDQRFAGLFPSPPPGTAAAPSTAPTK
ncbi:MAG TPA: peptidylprolyl isomerase [Candidatus Baltobacteraceae bacterium]|jgi:foldase protein PrsA|nr:peptidylprolyl isomerase [Candidatus Baltobacteraceae bacterium]